MGRLNSAVLERAEGVADRVLVLAKELDRRRVYLRVVDQLVGCGTSVGANIFEANEAMSTKDWLKCMGIAAKELAETRF